MAAVALVVSSLILMLCRTVAPFGQRVEGQELLTVRLGLRERIVYHRRGLYAFGVILLVLAAGGLLSRPLQVLAVLACYGVLLIPLRYRLTSVGVAVNNVVFRRWSEFAEVDVTPRALTLRGRPGYRPFTLRLLAQHQPAALAVVRRQLRLAASGDVPTAGRDTACRPRRSPAQ